MLLNRLRRVTRDGRWIPEIDGVRFVAIMSVVLYHMLAELAERSGRTFAASHASAGILYAIGHGDRGVRLFFIISGFVLALPFARHCLTGANAVSLRKYFLRRVTRLEPPYFLSVLIFLSLLIGYTRHVTADTLKHAAASLFYLHSLIYGQMTPINPVSWSLEVEIQFYLAAPLFMLLFRVRNSIVRRTIFVALIAAISLAEFPLAGSQRATLTIAYHAQFFLMGLLIADIYILDGHRLRSSWLWDIAGLLSLVCMFGLPGRFIPDQVVMPWAMSLMLMAALRSFVLRRFFANPWIAAIGGMCYSIYLMHFQFIAVFFKATRHLLVPRLGLLPNLAFQVVVTALPVVLLCTVYFVLIERPCMDPNWPTKLHAWFLSKRPRRVQPMATAAVLPEEVAD